MLFVLRVVANMKHERLIKFIRQFYLAYKIFFLFGYRFICTTIIIKSAFPYRHHFFVFQKFSVGFLVKTFSAGCEFFASLAKLLLVVIRSPSMYRMKTD